MKITATTSPMALAMDIAKKNKKLADKIQPLKDKISAINVDIRKKNNLIDELYISLPYADHGVYDQDKKRIHSLEEDVKALKAKLYILYTRLHTAEQTAEASRPSKSEGK